MRVLLALGAAAFLGLGVYHGLVYGFGINSILMIIAGSAWGAVVAWEPGWRILR